MKIRILGDPPAGPDQLRSLQRMCALVRIPDESGQGWTSAGVRRRLRELGALYLEQHGSHPPKASPEKRRI